MKTRCPGCQTTFRVTPEQLKARAGKVRCGQCQSVFNALDSLLEDPTTATPGAETVTTLPTPATESRADTTTVAVLEPTVIISEPEPPSERDIDIILEPLSAPAEPTHSAETAAPQTAADTIQPLSETPAQELGKATGLILPREMTEVPGYSKWTAGVMAGPLYHEPEKPTRWPYVLVAIVLSLALLGQLAFRFRGELAITMPAIRPALEVFCEALGADIPLPRHVDLVSIESSDLQNDAARGNLLVLNATVRNRAGYAQAYPSLELALTDTQDNAIARRVFAPEEYLPAKLKPDQPFPANSDIAVRLWIEAKEIPAAGYRLYVFYP